MTGSEGGLKLIYQISQEKLAQVEAVDGRGHALDNVFVERLWQLVKYEHVYLH